MKLARLCCTAAFLVVGCSSAPAPKPDGAAGPAQAARPGSGQTPPEAAGSSAAPATPPAAPAATPAPVPTPAPSADARPAAPVSGVDLAALDRAADPCDDFYQFACGTWLKSTPIPDDQSRWSRSFSEIYQRNEALLRQTLEANAKGEPDAADPFAQKVGDFYATCMDEPKAETASMETLRETLATIDRLKDKKRLARLVGELHRTGTGGFFRFSSEQDFKDSTQVIGGMDQGGLGLPDRDYYVKNDPRFVELRAFYEGHVARMLQLLAEPGEPADSAAKAKRIVTLETALAKVSMDKVARRDPDKVYHRLERKGLQKQAPHFGWADYFKAVGVPKLTAVNVAVPGFFKGMDELIVATPLPDLKAYLRWRAVESAANALGSRFVEERFSLARKLSGAKKIQPRWKRCVAMTDRALGEAVGRTFVVTTIGDEGKKIAKEMIQGIEDAFEKNLGSLDWMDQTSKDASLQKLKKIDNKVGYPDKWRDYRTMKIGRVSLLANLRAAAAFASHRDVTKIGKPVDKGEWGMSPPTVNAYYNPSRNEMVFPAGILQIPFFSPTAEAASNYGGAGLVMGHELTHGFDDQGRRFDADGNLHEWWSPEVTKKFKEKAECVARQYDGYVAVDDVHVNGHLTLGENIADIGGLKLALNALRARPAADANKPAPAAGGFTRDQQFFLSFAQSWCTNMRPEMLRQQATTDPHSAARWRVNGPISDSPEFAAAFQCKQGAKMNPADRCVVW